MDDDEPMFLPRPVKRTDPRAIRVIEGWVKSHGGAQPDGQVIDRGFYLVEAPLSRRR